jgi:hypothetical protein
MQDAYREGTPEAWRVARRQPVPPRTHTSVYRKVIEYAVSLWVPVWEDSTRTTATSPYLRAAIKRRSNSSRVIWPLSASSQARFPAGSANHPAVVIRKSFRRTSAAAARSPRRRASNSSRSACSRSSTRGDPIDSKPERRLRHCAAVTPDPNRPRLRRLTRMGALSAVPDCRLCAALAGLARAQDPGRQICAITSTTVMTASATPPTVNSPTVRNRSGTWPPVRSACSNSRWRWAPTSHSPTASDA